MSGVLLKQIALLLMIIDHAGVVLLNDSEWYELCRILGRLAFPIYAFLLAEGYVHTRSIWNYAKRMFIFALISEVVFDYAIFGTWFYPGHQNVFFTLLFGLAALLCYDVILGYRTFESSSLFKGKDEKNESSRKISKAYQTSHTYNWEKKILHGNIAKICIVVLLLIAELANLDYGAFGVLLILIFYQFRKTNQKYLAAALAIILYVSLTGYTTELYALAALILIWFYNGEKGKTPLPAIFFYAAYPAHLLVLTLLK